MKKLFLFILTFVIFGCVCASAAEEKKLPAFEVYSVSSDDLNASDSLDRISGGKYETGYVSKEFTYKSNDHGRSDPLKSRSYDDVTSDRY